MQISIQKNSGGYAVALRTAGFRATYGRIALLVALAEAGKPLSVETLSKKLKGKLDLTNTYRAVEALEKADLVHRVDLGHDHAHYELVGEGHHHHIVCENCGKVARVELKEPELERGAQRPPRDFADIRTHELEFFGTCRACV